MPNIALNINESLANFISSRPRLFAIIYLLSIHLQLRKWMPASTHLRFPKSSLLYKTLTLRLRPTINNKTLPPTTSCSFIHTKHYRTYTELLANLLQILLHKPPARNGKIPYQSAHHVAELVQDALSGSDGTDTADEVAETLPVLSLHPSHEQR